MISSPRVCPGLQDLQLPIGSDYESTNVVIASAINITNSNSDQRRCHYTGVQAIGSIGGPGKDELRFPSAS